MIKTEDVNLAMVKQVAKLLGPLLPKVVFLGGAATGLLITDEAAQMVRKLMAERLPASSAVRLSAQYLCR